MLSATLQPPTDHLTDLRRLRQKRDRSWSTAQREIGELAREAREAGVSVIAIAEALGMTRAHVYRLMKEEGR